MEYSDDRTRQVPPAPWARTSCASCASAMAARAFVRDPEQAAGVLANAELAAGSSTRTRSTVPLRGVDRLLLACGNVPGQVELERTAIDAARAQASARREALRPARRARLAAAVRALARGDRGASPALRPAGRAASPDRLHDQPAGERRGGPPHRQAVRPRGARPRISYVDPRDVAAAAAVALAMDGHEGAAYELTRTRGDRVRAGRGALSAATGHRISTWTCPARPPAGDARDGHAGDRGRLHRRQLRGEREGSMSRTTDAVSLLIGRKPGTFARFARDHARVCSGPARPRPRRPRRKA